MCPKGSFSDATMAVKAECQACPAGTFQDTLGATSCKPCSQGRYCPAGAAAPLPCTAGTYSTATNLKSAAECTDAGPGFYATTGSTVQTVCPKGSFSDATMAVKAECQACPAGTFQDALGATFCKPCPPGFYCIDGSATGAPCPGGTSSSRPGQGSLEQCTLVTDGFWAPLGSATPEPCPVSGFYCPGAAADTVNSPGGSKPILVPTGGSKAKEQVPAVTKELTLDLSCEYFNITAIVTALAAQYSVEPSLISLTDPCATASRARLLQSGSSLTLTITIATSATAADGSSVSAPMADLLKAAQSVGDGALGSALGSALGTNVTVTASSPAAQATVQRTVSSICPRGKWCTAGLVVECPIGTYNNRTGQNFATACTRCPEYSTTLNASSTSIADCTCQQSFIESITADGSVRCECAAGMGIVGGQSCSLCAVGSYKDNTGNAKARASHMIEHALVAMMIARPPPLLSLPRLARSVPIAPRSIWATQRSAWAR